MGHFSFLWFFEAVPWCLAVVLAFAGWGDLLLLSLRQSRSWLLAFCTGLPFLVAVGGLLNLLHLIRGGIILFIVLAGAALAIVKLWRGGITVPACWKGSRFRAGVVLLVLLCAALLFVRLSASIHRVGYQQLDDLGEYLAFPQKMLQTHHYATDPFSERRIINSVGPAYFLQTFVVAMLPLNMMQMADIAVGVLLLVFFILSVAAEWKLPPLHAAVGAVFALLMIQATFNLTFTTLPSALMLAMASVACSEEVRNNPVKLGLLLGGLAAVTAGLKSVYLPHAVLFCVFFFVFQAWPRGVRYSLSGLVATAAGFLGVLGTWMIAMHSTSRTFLYPVLGKGYHYTSYYRLQTLHVVTTPDHDITKALKLLAAELLLVAILVYLDRHDEDSKQTAGPAAVAALALAGIAGTLVMHLATGGDAAMRYNAPGLVPALLLLYPLFAVFVARHPKSIAPRLALGFSLIPLCTMTYRLGHSQTYGQFHPVTEAGALAHNFVAGFQNTPLPNEEARGEYQALEQAIPQGSTTLTTLATPFYLDFSKRTIYLAGFPGAASLPPGWPVYGSGDDLARYLLTHSIRYLSFSYGDSANDTDAFRIWTYESPTTTTVVKNESFLILQAHRQYRDLAKTRKHIYDDGKIYLLDLAQPR
jgi:hypothetical protein